MLHLVKGGFYGGVLVERVLKLEQHQGQAVDENN